ncbi:MAG: uroporphyrinogen decarboxylase family protein [Sphaerochaetaceae bacterium]
MTSRERVLAACNHTQPDRVPVDHWFRDDVCRNFCAYLGVETKEELLQLLGIDMRALGVQTHNPTFMARVNGILGDAVEQTGLPFIFYEDGSFEDEWGVLRKNGSDGLYTEWKDGPFVKTPDLDLFPWPSVDIVESQESVSQRVEAIRAQGDVAIRGSISNPFKDAWQMRGMENLLCDMLIDPDFAVGLIEKVSTYLQEKAIRLVRAGVDMLGIVGDLATQTSLLFSVELWRDIIRPSIDKIIASAREINPEIILFFHSDGNLDQIMEELIDTGFTVINPIQPECMDLYKTKDRFGHTITLHGTISIQELLPFGSVDDIHREVAKIVDYCGKDGGLIISPSNLIQNDTPMENILALYEAATGQKLG